LEAVRFHLDIKYQNIYTHQRNVVKIAVCEASCRSRRRIPLGELDQHVGTLGENTVWLGRDMRD
jgi:hypothetical protein